MDYERRQALSIEKIKEGFKCHQRGACKMGQFKECPYRYYSDDIISPRTDPFFREHELESVKRCRDELIADCEEYIELLEERIAIMSEGRRRGKWMYFEGVLTCSECNTAFYDEIMEYCGDNVPRYCPWCGTNMEAQEEKEQLNDNTRN